MKNNYVFVKCDNCTHDGKCRQKPTIPWYCVKGCVVPEDGKEKVLERRARNGK